MYCKECGFQLSDDAKFCPSCGTKVELSGVGNIEQKAVFGSIEADETDDIESIDKQAEWSGVAVDSYGNERRKEILSKKTTEPLIFIRYYCYADDKTMELSPQWYADPDGTMLSNEYDKVSEIIDCDMTFVKKNGK